jgi:hypothetical protein
LTTTVRSVMSLPVGREPRSPAAPCRVPMHGGEQYPLVSVRN